MASSSNPVWRTVLAAVVGLSLTHPSLSFQSHRALQFEVGHGPRGGCCPFLRPPPAGMPAVGARSRPVRRWSKPPRMTATEPEAVGEVQDDDMDMDTAARRAEEEASACVSEVVEIMMHETAATMAPAPHGSLPPRLWLDNVDALLNEPVYKSVMYQRLESCSSEQELVLLEVVDEKLLQFKKEQRDTRNKAKLEYIIGAALDGPQALDDTLLDLSATRGLDDGLVDYLDEIVDKARNADLTADTLKSPDADKETQLVKMLTVIKDRVVAEIRTRDKPHVRMLAALLRMDATAEREAFLRGAVQNPESAARFEEFVLDGIQYMEQHRADWLVDERVEKMKDIAREVAQFRELLERRR